MKLIEAKINNFRLLHDFKITFDDNTTSIVGKNNSGKTSLSVIFNIFLSGKSFSFEDFSFKSHEKFIEVFNTYKNITKENREEKLKEIQKLIPKIQLLLKIKYFEEDSWVNIKTFLTNLEENDEINILCEYVPISSEKFLINLSESMKDLEYSDNNLLKEIESLYQDHYKVYIRPYSESEETDNVNRNDLKKLIQAKFINAQRVLDDSSSEYNSKLSKIFQDLFINEKMKDVNKPRELLNAIEEASIAIDSQLSNFFAPFIEYFKEFGFPGLGNEKVELKSQLEPEILFNHNIKLFYDHKGKKLPEKYNGLGYSNLIYIITQILGFYNEISKIQNDLNLIFIEEPEVHMHPQMQSVFIKNIENFIKKVGLRAQIIITTHSSCILSDSKLEGIRYFTREGEKNDAVVKDLMDFNNKLTEDETRKFLQQYLTLGKCDLFFADKAILFEGTVERILLPIFIKKIDEEKKENKFLGQYIAPIEVGGAYIYKFKELLEFLDLKTLIITDIDSVSKTNYGKIGISEDDQLETCNVTLKNWIPGENNILKLLSKSDKEKIYKNIRVAYQTNVSDKNVKCGRSFEESFIIDNPQYIFDNRESLTSIKNHLEKYKDSDDVKKRSYEIQDFIDKNNKKIEFTFDLLNIDKDNWKVPAYIKEGLEWLAK